VSELEFGEAKSQRLRTGTFDSTVGPNHAMRRHEQIDRRQRHGRGNAPMRQRVPDCARDFGIRHELAKRERGDGTPYRDLKCAAVEFER
jgi:hypothetical protein